MSDDNIFHETVSIIEKAERGELRKVERVALLTVLDAVPREDYDRYREALKDIATDELGSYEMVGIAQDALEAADE